MAASILIVEDERIIAKGIEKRLKGMQYVVAGIASNGEAAVQMASDLSPDLILMDIDLGAGIDGIEAAAQIRAQSEIPVVFLTAFSDPATLLRAKCTEPFGYILKPFEDRDLQTALEIGLYKHQMDRRVRENERWLAATLGSIGDGVIATDSQGIIRLINPLAERLTGWLAIDAVGRDVREVFRIVDERTRRTVPNPLVVALHTGSSTELAPGTILIDRSGAERPIADSAAPIRGANDRVSGGVLVFRDITERIRLEDHLRQAQKMEAIGRLAGGIAHDFNNIVTIISGYCEFLLSGDHGEEDRKLFVRAIHDASKRAASLTQQITAFSRKQLLQPRVLDLNAVVAETVEMVKRLIGTDIVLETDLAPELAPVKADPTQLGQIFLNLASNARDAMPQGGRLRIATSNAVLGESTTRDFLDVPAGPYSLLTVADTGTGIPEAILDRIFEPFFTTKPIGHGTGLGLATVYGIVKQSGGHIAVTSRLGEGTAFLLYLPSVAPAPGVADEAIFTKPVGGHETILLVEDEDMVRSMIKLLLEMNGYKVLEASDGIEALALAESHDGAIDLLMSDLMMPNMSGRELADRLFAGKRVGRVLFLSGYSDDNLQLRDLSPGVSAFLHKPFELNALISKVREVLDW